MRRLLLACVGLAAAAAALLPLAERRAEPPNPAEPPAAAAAAPETPSSAPAPPEPAPPSQETAPPQQEATLPPAPPALPPLPEQDVPEQPVHPVPDYRTAPIPHVTMEDRNGNPIGRSNAAPVPGAPPSATPPPSRPQQAPPPAPATLTGPAQATGTTMLALQGHSVRLFGIAAPASGDRCQPGKGEPRPCTEVAQQTLAEHLAHSATITCALPPGVPAGAPARICLDDKGVDIAGILVAEGLALDDPRQTRDYRRAEGVARSLKKGLWAYR